MEALSILVKENGILESYSSLAICIIGERRFAIMENDAW
jgi:hypothetical protein